MYSFACVARTVVLLKPNVATILLFNFCEQKFVQHGPITIVIDFKGLSLLIFEEKWQTVTRFGGVGFSMYACGFSVPKCDNFSCLHIRQASSENMIFFCQNRHLL